ncbi:MAG: hypothetical protein LC121_10000 [Anaerolineae bacterium]|nr:hypothetical protein [Anaerolineae bacterium]
MQNPTAWLLFALFGDPVRDVRRCGGAGHRRWYYRRWALASVIVMTLTGLAQNNTIYQALFAGLLVGGLFSGGTVAMAAYFQSSEARQRAAQAVPPEEMEA